jgi:hypothetical protein
VIEPAAAAAAVTQDQLPRPGIGEKGKQADGKNREDAPAEPGRVVQRLAEIDAPQYQAEQRNPEC